MKNDCHPQCVETHNMCAVKVERECDIIRPEYKREAKTCEECFSHRLKCLNECSHDVSDQCAQVCEDRHSQCKVKICKLTGGVPFKVPIGQLSDPCRPRVQACVVKKQECVSTCPKASTSCVPQCTVVQQTCEKQARTGCMITPLVKSGNFPRFAEHDIIGAAMLPVTYSDEEEQNDQAHSLAMVSHKSVTFSSKDNQLNQVIGQQEDLESNNDHTAVGCAMRFKQCFESRVECHNTCDKRTLVEAEDVTGKCHPKCITVHRACENAARSRCKVEPEYKGDTCIPTASKPCDPNPAPVRLDSFPVNLVSTPKCEARFRDCDTKLTDCHSSCSRIASDTQVVALDEVAKCHPRCIKQHQQCSTPCVAEPEYKSDTCKSCQSEQDTCASQCKNDACSKTCRNLFLSCKTSNQCESDHSFIHPVVVGSQVGVDRVSSSSDNTPFVGEHDNEVPSHIKKSIVQEFIRRQVAFNKDTVTELQQLRTLQGLTAALPIPSTPVKDVPSVSVVPKKSSSSVSLVEEQDSIEPLAATLRDLKIEVEATEKDKTEIEALREAQ